MNKFSWEYLSVTRFFLACVVLCGHLTEFAPIGSLNLSALSGSYEAVLGFLLISGFSIGKSLQRNPRSFIKRRLQRLYPVYVASIVFAFAVTFPHLVPGTFWELFWNLLFLNQIVTTTSFVGPAWSLSLEVWLYCLAPVLFRVSAQRLRGLMYVSFACCSLYAGGRVFFDQDYFSSVGFGLNLLLLSFVWIAGFAYSKNQNFRKDILFLLIGHVLVLAVLKFIHYAGRHEIQKFVFVYSLRLLLGAFVLALSAVVILCNDQLPKVSSRVRYWFHLLGNISYPLYLTHYATFRLLSKFTKPAWYVFAPSALLVATVFYFAFDFYSQNRMKKQSKQILLQPGLLKDTA